MPLPRLGSLLCFLALSLSPSLGFAQDDENYELMLELSDRATEAVLSGDFQLGAITFRKAYQASPDPILLKNEMIAWYRAGDCRSALPPARAFLQTDDVEPQDRDDVHTVEVECHLTMASDSLDTGELLLATYHLGVLDTLELEGDDLAAFQHLNSRLSREEPVEAPFGYTAESQIPPQRNHLRTWIPVVAGVGILGAGATIHTVALDRQAQLEQFSTSEVVTDQILLYRRQQDWGDFQRRAQWLVPTLYALGAASIGAGIFFHVQGGSDAPAVSLTPALSTQAFGLDLSGRF